MEINQIQQTSSPQQEIPQNNVSTNDIPQPKINIKSLKSVLLPTFILCLFVVTVIGSYNLGVQNTMKKVKQAEGIVGISSVTPENSSTTTTVMPTPTRMPFPSPSPYKAPVYTRSTPNLSCSTNDDCMLFDNSRTTYVEMGCGGNQCPNDFDSNIIAVNKQWYLQEHDKAAHLVGACSQIALACSPTITQSWKEVQAVCKNSVCTKLE